MVRIKLIVTGDMEKLALHESLRRFFPSNRDGEDVTWDLPRRVSCATSHQLKEGHPPSRPMQQLARAMLDEVGIGKTGQPADLVVVIDDVELGNLEREVVVAQHFRLAVNTCLEAHDANTEVRYRNLLRKRCSFHLLKPMVEAYFFGDAAALQTSGVPAGTTPRLVHTTDVEQFETDDPAWLPTCHTENSQRQRRSTPWWQHERHSKHYLEHLTARGGVFYDETFSGRHALKGLSWTQVPKSPADAPIVRSLFEDIADWFGILSPLGRGLSDPQFYPAQSVDRARLLLRNM